MSKRIYLDNAATTRTAPEVIREMRRYFDRTYGNPSSVHRAGALARAALEMARERIAGVLRCASDELVFTGSGSEGNTLAIHGAAAAHRDRGRHIVTSAIEHRSVLEACAALERDGFTVSHVQVDRLGRILPDHLEACLREDTILVSLGFANNEIGTVQDVSGLVAVVRRRRALLHLDAVQILPYRHLDLASLGADLVTFSGHKIYAPKGVGVLYVRRDTRLRPVIHGGEQEFGLRAGTENVPSILGLSRAIQLHHLHREKYCRTLLALRDRLLNGVLRAVPGTLLTGDPEARLPNHASFAFAGLSGRALVRELDERGFDVSSGSACAAGRTEPSHVLLACGIPPSHVRGSLRVTLGRFNRPRDVERFLRALPGAVRQACQTEEAPADQGADAVFISQDEFRRRLAEGPPLQVLDVRHVRFPRAMIPGSHHVPIWRLHAAPAALDRQTETVVVCYQGDDLSPRVRQRLLGWGFTRVRVLKGGVMAYCGFIPSR